MHKQQRPFYIVAHNPNDVETVTEAMRLGANALAPDVMLHNGTYHVCHGPEVNFDDKPTITQYLADLKNVIAMHPKQLALIIWDLKNSTIDPNDFADELVQLCTGSELATTAMVLTHGSDYNMFNGYDRCYPLVGLGVDESNDSPGALLSHFKAHGHQQLCYADGITGNLDKPGIFNHLQEAVGKRRTAVAAGYSLIYVWVLKSAASMRAYLSLGIDAIMVDVAEIALLKDIITSATYASAYTLANNGHHPFKDSSLPGYLLSIDTSNRLFAGTNAIFTISIIGSSGDSLTSLPFDASMGNALERGTVTQLVIEGAAIGCIQQLSIAPLSGGWGSDWLPGKITVTPQHGGRSSIFDFDTNDWVTKRKGETIKTVYRECSLERALKK